MCDPFELIGVACHASSWRGHFQLRRKIGETPFAHHLCEQFVLRKLNSALLGNCLSAVG
jgi:hypothetical protein